MKYFDAICESMKWLGEQPDTVFLGQAVRDAGTAMFTTLRDVPMEKRIEMPVAEDMQLGISTGLSLNGFVPISIYPRINFLLCAIPQLVLHLDKLPLYSGYRPKVIIRTAIATDRPLDPGVQHLGDYSDAIGGMLKTVRIKRVGSPDGIIDAYRQAYAVKGSTIIVEYLDLYNE